MIMTKEQPKKKKRKYTRKNPAGVTLQAVVPPELARTVKIIAAQQKRSVSSVITDMLESQVKILKGYFQEPE